MRLQASLLTCAPVDSAATWFRGKEGRVIQLFNPLLEPAYTATLDHLPGSLDCTLDSS